MNPLRYFSRVAAASPKKLSFDNVSNQQQQAPFPEVAGAPFVVATRGEPRVDPVATRESLIPGASLVEVVDVTTTPAKTTPRGKRGQSPPEASEIPTPGRGKKTANGGQRPSSAGKPAHHHRRSLSNLTKLENNGAASPADCPPARTLRQSASFSGISAPRGGRPPTSGEISVPVFGNGTAIAAPRSTGKPVRYANSKALTKCAANGYGEDARIELKEDPSFWMDHSVQVLIRARPLSAAEVEQDGVERCLRQENAQTVSWLGQPETRFTFDHVAGEFVTQEKLFRVAGLPMVDNCMAGYNSCMFVYGQTGSGKTHTMLGDIGQVDSQPNVNRGMTPRVYEYLFAKILKEEEAQKHAKLKFKCTCSFLEIYNEQISDLLEPTSINLQMREDLNKGVFVEGLLEVEVKTVEDVMHLLQLGATNRKVAATNMNRESSRSHCVFTCVIESQWECDSMINFRFGRLNLVDLAGSERQKATGADGERLREAASINKSLSTLGLVIMVLVDVANGKQRHVPYRDSKLTFLLQDSLGGNSKTTIIANISPSTCASSETLSTLKFAQRAKFIQNNAVINEEASGDVRGLQLQIQQLKDELARVRRQSVSRMPTVSTVPTVSSVPNVQVPETNAGELSSSIENNIGGSKDGFDPLRSSTEGSFLHFGRALLVPTVLSQKLKSMETLLADALRREKLLQKTTDAEIEHLTRMVKHREDEKCLQKSLLESRKHKIRRLEGPSETNSERDVAASQDVQVLQAQCDHPEHLRLTLENRHLQEQLRRCQQSDAFKERETMSQDIAHLREQLLDMLDQDMSADASSLPQQTALVTELAAERQVAELLRNEMEAYRRDLADCRMKLQTSLESNERVSSEFDALRMELESSQEECRIQRQELGILQAKSQEVESLESKQAQHQQFMVELKTQLQKSEEKAEREASRRSQLELQLQEALQESTNLQTELQWTRDALEDAELLVDTLQRHEPLLEKVDPGGSYESFMIGQLQKEIIEMSVRLEDERKRGKELEEQVERYGDREEYLDDGIHMRNVSTDSWDYSTGRHRVRHHDAIMQLQMELEMDGGSPSASRDPIKGYRWEVGTRDDEAEVKHTVTIMQLQLDMEALECALAEEQRRHAQVIASSEILQQQLADAERKLCAELEMAQALHGHHSPVRDAVVRTTGDMEKMEEALVIARDHFNLEKQTLLRALADAEERFSTVKKELAVRQKEFLSVQERCQCAEARELAVQEERAKLEDDVVKLKEQAAQEHEEWVLEKSDLVVSVRDSEARCVEKDQKIVNLEKIMTASTEQGGLRNQVNSWRSPNLEKKLATMTHAMEKLGGENLQLQRELELLRTDAENARKLVAQKEQELSPMARKLADMEVLVEQENNKVNALTLSFTSPERTWADHVEKENRVRKSGSELVKSTDRSLRPLRKPRRLSEGGTQRVGGIASAEKIAKQGSKVPDHRHYQSFQLDGTKPELQAAMKETQRYKDLVQRGEAEMERLTLLLLETEERQIKAEQAWREEKFELQAQRHEAELEVAARKLKLPAPFAKMEQWRRQVSEADNLMTILVQANEKAKQQSSQASVDADNLLQEFLDLMASTKDQLDATMGHAEDEIRAIAFETQQLKSDLKHALLDPCKAVLAEQEATIHDLRAELTKARKQAWSVQADQGATVRALQEKEETIRKLLNDLNEFKHLSLRQTLTNEIRQSLSKEEHALPPPLRRSFSCRLIEEKEMTLTVLKEETEFLKSLVFSLDTENGDLQQQLLEFEMETTALKSAVANLEREKQNVEDSNAKLSEDAAVLELNLLKSTRRISELECLRSELRDVMQRQAVTLAGLYGELQKQEGLHDIVCPDDDTVRTDECKMEEKSVLDILGEEKVQLKSMVENLDAEMYVYKLQSCELKIQVAALQQELEARDGEERDCCESKIQVAALQQEIEARSVEVRENVLERTKLEDELRSTKLELVAERDKLQTDLNLFVEQLESAQALAGEMDVAASEARKMAELNKTRADEKQVEVEILGRSVEELENTVYALESQVGLLNRDCDRQRLLREEMESELQGLQNQISILHAALTEATSRSNNDLVEMTLRKEDAERMLEDREAETTRLRNKLEKLQMGIGASVPVSPAPSPIQKHHKGHTRSASAFGCIKMGHQVQSELEEERNEYQRRIQELEEVLENHESEVTMLHEKLDDAERMTRDVLRVLRGVKVDMTNVATILGEQEEGERHSESETLEKDDEIEHILTRLNDLIEERESWLETISRKQAELVASQAIVESLREREKSLVAENKKFKLENRTQLKRIGQLEQENKTLSGQQNLQQRIKHHAKIKEENNTLRVQNNELSSKMRRLELVNTRVSEELAKYRTAQGKPSALNVEEEQRLRSLLQDMEEQRDLEAQKLARLCASVLKAAGKQGDTCIPPATAVEAVEQLKLHLESLRQEFEDFKLKTKILGERHRLNELRTANSPLRGIDPQLTPR